MSAPDSEDSINLSVSLSGNPDGVLITNSDGMIEYVNNAFLSMIRMPYVDVIKKNIFTNSFFLPIDTKQKLREIIQKENIWRGEIKFLLDDQNEKNLLITLIGIKDKHYHVINYLELVEDISLKNIDIEGNLNNTNPSDLDLLKIALNNNPQGILIADSNGVIEYVNGSFLRSLNKSYYTVIEQNLFNDQLFLPVEFKKEVIKSLGKGKIWKGEIKYKNSSEDERTLLITILAIKNKEKKIINFLELVEDVTPFANIYSEIEKEKEKLETIVEIIPEGIMLFDLNNVLLQTNSKINDIYYSLYKSNLNFDLLNRNINDFKSENLIINVIRKLLLNEQASDLIELKDNFFIKIMKFKVQKGTILVFYDLSEQIKLNNFKNQLISTVSHELRSPSSAIVQSLTNLTRYDDRLTKDEKDKLLSIGLKNANLLVVLVDDLLILSKIDMSSLKLIFKQIDLNVLIENVIEQFKFRLEELNININFNYSGPIILEGDEKRISQVIRILIDNAIKYSHSNSIIEIEVLINYTGEYNQTGKKGILLKVKDYGIGIPDADKPNLFNRFFRAKNATSFKGTGLGLCIAKSFIELHGGSIFFDSIENKETTFFVLLPF